MNATGAPSRSDLVDLVDDRDRGMDQRGRGTGFREQPVVCGGVGPDVRAQELQRDGSAEPQVFREVDLAEPAAAQRPVDAVVRERLAGHDRHHRAV